jgi:hypothetical protein
MLKVSIRAIFTARVLACRNNPSVRAIWNYLELPGKGWGSFRLGGFAWGIHR